MGKNTKRDGQRRVGESIHKRIYDAWWDTEKAIEEINNNPNLHDVTRELHDAKIHLDLALAIIEELGDDEYRDMGLAAYGVGSN